MPNKQFGKRSNTNNEMRDLYEKLQMLFVVFGGVTAILIGVYLLSLIFG